MKPHIARYPRWCNGYYIMGWGLWDNRRKHLYGFTPDVWSTNLKYFSYRIQ